jgi:two-component system, NtrC family, response regulator HydG
MARILIIDDDTFICKAIQKQLVNKGYQADVAYSGMAGLKMLKKYPFDLVFCDFRLPDKDGMSILQEIKRMDTVVPVVIMTAYADVRVAVNSIKQGAKDYIAKPLQPEEILSLAKKFTEKNIKEKQWQISDDFIVGNSRVFNEAVRYASKVAPTDISVLIEGETGTGKEYIARYIHEHSRRSKKSFVAVDCGAIPKDLAGSELFGHVKGSFTGAVANKTGVFQQANGGTLFLDEIGNLSYGVQVQLLRVLQEKIIVRIGENKLQKVDVRIIAASNEDLAELVDNNSFREDLFHRINEFKIILPALRNRTNDIPVFAEYFRERANKELNQNIKGFSDETMKVLAEYPWPGNIREMKNVIKRAVLLAKGDTVSVEDLPFEISYGNEKKNSGNDINEYQGKGNILQDVLGDTEKEMIIKAIEDAGYNKSKAARILNIDRKTLYNKIRQYKIEI